MEIAVLKKKIDGYRNANRSIKKVPPELLIEIRQTWEHYSGSMEQFRSELGIKTGTLRNLLREAKKLNHVIASMGAVGVTSIRHSEGDNAEHNDTSTMVSGVPNNVLELTFDHGSKTIRFPSLDLLIDFMRKAV